MRPTSEASPPLRAREVRGSRYVHVGCEAILQAGAGRGTSDHSTRSRVSASAHPVGGFQKVKEWMERPREIEEEVVVVKVGVVEVEPKRRPQSRREKAKALDAESDLMLSRLTSKF